MQYVLNNHYRLTVEFSRLKVIYHVGYVTVVDVAASDGVVVVEKATVLRYGLFLSQFFLISSSESCKSKNLIILKIDNFFNI